MSKKDNLTAHSSQEYDQQVRKTIPFYESFHNQTIALIKVLTPLPELWLDTGCGTGSMFKNILAEFKSTHFVFSDPSEAMLNEVKRNLAYVRNKAITILEPYTTQSIQWNGKPFDVITAIMVHHYLSIEERIEATRRCFELLKPGGVYITFETIKPETETAVNTGLAMWKEFQLSHGKSEDEVKKHLSRYGTELKPVSIPNHLEIIKKTGFATIELFWHSCLQAGFYAIK